MAKNSLFFQHCDWEYILYSEYTKPYFLRMEAELGTKILDEGKIVCPSPERIFKPFSMCPYRKAKVIFVLPAPHTNYKHAEGLALSVPSSTSKKNLPRNLVNFLREFRRDLKIAPEVNINPHLGSWCEQGVLLMNMVLTAEQDGKRMDHSGLGWENFTRRMIGELNDRLEPLVFVFMGSGPDSLKAAVTNDRHKVILLPDPAPNTAHRGFYFSGIFTKINEFLNNTGQMPIYWESICYKKYQ